MVEPLGLALGYWVLFGVITAFHSLMELTPKIVNKSKKMFMDWLYFYRELSTRQNEDGCKALLIWFLTHQHLLKKSPGMILNHMLDCMYLLPQYNKQFEVETAYGTIYFAIISADDLNIHGFRVSVRRRGWLFGKQKTVNLDRLITFMIDEVCRPCCIYYHERSETLIEKNNNKYYDEKIPEQLKVIMQKLYNQFRREYLKKHSKIITDKEVSEEVYLECGLDSESD